MDEDNVVDESGTEAESKGSGLKVVIAVIIVIILIGAGVFIWLNTLPGVTDVIVKVVPGEEQHQVKLDCNVITGGMDEYTGTGKINVEYQDGTSTYQGSLDITEGHGERVLNFEDFVIGNGIYEITIEVDDMEATIEYEVSVIVEKIDAYVQLPDAGDPVLNILFTDQNGRNLKTNLSQEYLDLEIMVEIENQGSTEFEERTGVHVYVNYYQLTFQRFGQLLRGNYSFDITVTNKAVQPNSEFYQIRFSFNQVLDKAPTADPGGPYEYNVGLFENTKEVTLDATGSFDDGEITGYAWYSETVGFPNHEETAGDEEFDGTHTLVLSTLQEYYVVTLIVTDDAEPVPHNASVTFDIVFDK